MKFQPQKYSFFLYVEPSGEKDTKRRKNRKVEGNGEKKEEQRQERETEERNLTKEQSILSTNTQV